MLKASGEMMRVGMYLHITLVNVTVVTRYSIAGSDQALLAAICDRFQTLKHVPRSNDIDPRANLGHRASKRTHHAADAPFGGAVLWRAGMIGIACQAR